MHFCQENNNYIFNLNYILGLLSCAAKPIPFLHFQVSWSLILQNFKTLDASMKLSGQF